MGGDYIHPVCQVLGCMDHLQPKKEKGEFYVGGK